MGNEVGGILEDRISELQTGQINFADFTELVFADLNQNAPEMYPVIREMLEEGDDDPRNGGHYLNVLSLFAVAHNG